MNAIPRKVLKTLETAARFNMVLAVTAALSVTAVAYMLLATNAAGNASMYLQPSSGTYTPGQTLTVSVRVNTGGENTNAVQADFTYPANRLEFQSINESGSAYAINASSSGGDGSVSIARGNITNVSGDVLVAKVNFKVLSSPGAAALVISGSSAVVRSSDSTNILGTATGATYTISASATPPPSPSPSPSPSSPSPQPSPSPASPTPSPSSNTKPSPSPSSKPSGQQPAETPEKKDSSKTPSKPDANTSPNTGSQASADTAPTSGVSQPVLIATGVLGLLIVAGAATAIYLRHRAASTSVTIKQNTPRLPTEYSSQNQQPPQQIVSPEDWDKLIKK